MRSLFALALLTLGCRAHEPPPVSPPTSLFSECAVLQAGRLPDPSEYWPANSVQGPTNGMFDCPVPPGDCKSLSPLPLTASYLRQLGEAPLDCAGLDDASVAYRFYLQRSFTTDWAIRVESHGALAVVESTEGQSNTSGDTLEVVRRIRRQVPASDVVALADALELARFWRLPTQRPEVIATDGATWVFEAVGKGQHRVVVRTDPETSLREIGALFVELAGLPDDSGMSQIATAD